MVTDFSKISKDFFNSRDCNSTDEELAKTYLEYLRANRYKYEFLKQIYPDRENNLIVENVAVLADTAALPYATRRMPLLMDNTIITQYTGHPSWFYHKESYYPDAVKVTDGYAICELAKLGQWIKSCRELITSGNVFFAPSLFLHATYKHVEAQDIYNINIPTHAAVEGNRLVELVSTSLLSSGKDSIKPILSLDLPFLDNTDLETFCKVTVSETEALRLFRAFLHDQLARVDSLA